MNRSGALRNMTAGAGVVPDLAMLILSRIVRSAWQGRIFRSFAITGLCLAVALSATVASHAEPFSFRGISLGTTLADLRRIQFPEAPGARILCSHDAEAGDIRPTAEYVAPEDEAQAGVVVCGAYTFGKVLGAASKVLPAEWISARLNVGPIEASPFFWFSPHDKGDIEETGRLYRIAIRSNSAYWSQVRAAFLMRYGSATSIETIAFHQQGKRDIPAEILTWSKDDSTIRILQREEIGTRMTITYEHTGLKPRQP